MRARSRADVKNYMKTRARCKGGGLEGMAVASLAWVWIVGGIVLLIMLARGK
jgi:hypothetical protein